jgi:hypothetical protein
MLNRTWGQLYLICSVFLLMNCVAHSLTIVWIGDGLPFQIMCFFTGNSNKVPLPVMKNNPVFVICAFCPLEMKIFIYVYHIYLIYFMWWQLCVMEAVVSTSVMFNIVSNLSVLFFFSYNFNKVWNSSYVILTLECVFIVMSVTRTYFSYHISVCWEEKFETLCTHLVERYIILDTVSVEYILVFRVLVFPVRLFHPHFSCA